MIKTPFLERMISELPDGRGAIVIPGCSYVDDEFVEFVPDLMRIAEYSKDKKLAILGKIVTLGNAAWAVDAAENVWLYYAWNPM